MYKLHIYTYGYTSNRHANANERASMSIHLLIKSHCNSSALSRGGASFIKLSLNHRSSTFKSHQLTLCQTVRSCACIYVYIVLFGIRHIIYYTVKADISLKYSESREISKDQRISPLQDKIECQSRTRLLSIYKFHEYSI